MQATEVNDAKTLAVEAFGEYAGIDLERSRELLEKFYKQYVPRGFRNDGFWLGFALAVGEQYRKFYKPKDLRKEFLYLLGEIREKDDEAYNRSLNFQSNINPR